MEPAINNPIGCCIWKVKQKGRSLSLKGQKSNNLCRTVKCSEFYSILLLSKLHIEMGIYRSYHTTSFFNVFLIFRKHQKSGSKIGRHKSCMHPF